MYASSYAVDTSEAPTRQTVPEQDSLYEKILGGSLSLEEKESKTGLDLSMTASGVLEEALSFAEKKALVEAINHLPKRLLPGVVNIISQHQQAGLEVPNKAIYIDDLDTRTHRKLQSYVMEVRLTNDLLGIVT